MRTIKVLSVLITGILFYGIAFSQEEMKSKSPPQGQMSAPVAPGQKSQSRQGAFQIMMGSEGKVTIQPRPNELAVYSSRTGTGIPFSISTSGGRLDLRMLVDVLGESGFTQEVILKSLPRILGEIESRIQVQILGKDAYRSAWARPKTAPTALAKQAKGGMAPQPGQAATPHPALRDPADLTIVYLRAEATDENAYCVKIVDEVRNQGKGKASGFWITYYLVNLKYGLVSLLGGRYVPPLDPNQADLSLQDPQVFSHDGALPTGDYFLVAVADREYSVLEENKANNIKKFDGLLHLKNTSNCPKMTPDIFLQPQEFIIIIGGNRYAQTPGQQPTFLEVNRGSQLKLDVYLQNAPHSCGSGAYQWWENKVIEVEAGLFRVDNGDRIWLGTGCVTESNTKTLLMDPYAYQERVPVFTRCDYSDYALLLSIPQNLPAGEYWLYILIDPQNKFQETFKNNNLLFSGQILYIPQ